MIEEDRVSSTTMHSQHPPLSLSREEMRALGYRVVDMLVEQFDTLPEQPAAQIASRTDLEQILWEPVPEEGTDPTILLDQLRRDVFTHTAHVDHPRFFAFIPSPSNFVSVMADALASGFNVFTGTWLASSGPSMLELVTLDWLRALCGMPETTGGLFTSGGSAANLTALAVARHIRLRGRMEGAVVYASDQTHSSLDRALRVLGFAPGTLRQIPTDDAFRLDLSALRERVQEDRTAGRVPFCVIANAGTTNTGAVDPLVPLAAFCRGQDLWLHVDGAYGAAAVVVDEGRAALAGIEQADSLTLDPHKWFFQPYEIGCLLVRERQWLKDTFYIQPEYLKDTERVEVQEVNFADHGIQLTRSFRALKLWLSMKTFGLAAFRESVAHGLRLARVAERAVHDMTDWEVVTPAQMGIVTLRYAPPGISKSQWNRINQEILSRMQADGFAMLSSTMLRGQFVFRLCLINPRTTEADVLGTLEQLRHFVSSSLGT